MAYENGGCGPFLPAQIKTAYRGLKLQSNGTAVDLVVESYGLQQLLHLEPGEEFSGTLIIIDGAPATGLLGYIP